MNSDVERLLDQLSSATPVADSLLLRQSGIALVIVLVGMGAYWWMGRALAALSTRGRLSTHTSIILRRLGGWAIGLVVGLLVLEQFGLMEGAWAGLTAILAMVAVGFVAVWSVLSNVLCSILLMIVRPFNVGDTIELTGEELRGKVIDFNLIYTTLRTDEGSLLQVPNNMFFQKVVRRELGTDTVTLDQQADREQPTG